MKYLRNWPDFLARNLSEDHVASYGLSLEVVWIVGKRAVPTSDRRVEHF
jgi:hypothetical protein